MELIERMEVLEEQVDELKRLVKDKHVGLLNSHGEHLLELRKDVATLIVKVAVLEERVNALAARVEALERRVDALEKRIEALEKQVEALEKQVAALEKQVEALERRVAALEKVVENLVKVVELLDRNLTARVRRVELLQWITIAVLALQALPIYLRFFNP